MKIIIISIPRSGSTSLMKKLSSENGLDFIFEPWNTSRPREKYNAERDNVVLKTIVDQFPPNITQENSLEWYMSFVKDFDQIILLSRRDLDSCAESWAHFNHYYKTYLSTEKYYYDNPPNLEWAKKDITEKHNKLLEFGEKLNIPITYYEDVFDLNDVNRLRQSSPDNVVKKKIEPTII